MAAGQVAFVAPLAAARVPAGLFAALPAGAGTEVDYTARRDAGKPAADRGTYRVLEDDGMDLHGPRRSDPVVHRRRILVYSPANAAGQAKARTLKLAKAAAELDKLVRTAGTRFHPTDDAVAARVQAIAANRRTGKYLRTAITAGQAGKHVREPPNSARTSAGFRFGRGLSRCVRSARVAPGPQVGPDLLNLLPRREYGGLS